MSVTSVGNQASRSIGSALLQQLLGGNGTTGASETNGLSTGAVGDLLTLSSASQQLAQAPAAVSAAMKDLLSGASSGASDLTTLQSWFQQNPTSLTSVLSALQGGTATYGASGAATTSTSTLLAALASGQGTPSERAGLISLLNTQNQDPLLASSSTAASSSNQGVLSLFG